MQDSWVQGTRLPKGIMACWTWSRLCVGPVRTLPPLVGTRCVSLCLALVLGLPVSTCLHCLTTLKATGGATQPKVKMSHHVVHFMNILSLHTFPCVCVRQYCPTHVSLVQRKPNILALLMIFTWFVCFSYTCVNSWTPSSFGAPFCLCHITAKYLIRARCKIYYMQYKCSIKVSWP